MVPNHYPQPNLKKLRIVDSEWAYFFEEMSKEKNICEIKPLLDTCSKSRYCRFFRFRICNFRNFRTIYKISAQPLKKAATKLPEKHGKSHKICIFGFFQYFLAISTQIWCYNFSQKFILSCKQCGRAHACNFTKNFTRQINGVVRRFFIANYNMEDNGDLTEKFAAAKQLYAVQSYDECSSLVQVKNS